jgi:dTDP-4-dehydrorhamnose reductase
MKVAIIGSSGQLGRELVKVYGKDALPLDIGDVDIRDAGRLGRILSEREPDAVINTAAFHNVPACETESEKAFAVNALGVRNLRDACLARSMPLVHLSTDYVFDGRKNSPYGEDDTPNPVNVYGVSKLAGEFFARHVPSHFIIRISSLFGAWGCVGKGGVNFVKLMLEAARTRSRVAVSSNIFSSPTYAPDAAARIRDILEGGYPPGIYHVSNSGGCSWFEFAAEIFRRTGATIRLEERTETPDIEGGLRRPRYTVLRSIKIPPLRPWQEALADNLAEEQHLQA